ncbi:protein Wnt-9a-like [Amphiura filiformis]|uniref:protein Wnt-9a-like n=1 Tax=Amphiura filiformis TaxID=82378 RepID=UPI003B20DED8
MVIVHQCWVLTVLIFGIIYPTSCTAYFGLTLSKRLPLDRLTADCKGMRLTNKQRKMCYRDSGMADTLINAIRLSTMECTSQFKNERWNCSITHEHHRLNLLKTALKETSFIYAVSSAGLTHAIAQSCSSGELDRCSCDANSFDMDINKEAWKWGGCGDNLKYSVNFVKEFLKAQKGGEKRYQDYRAKVDSHNTVLGTRVVRKRMQKICKCHGVSGSCTTQTCWRQLSPFHEIGRDLKNKYENAMRVAMDNTANAIDQSLRVRRRERRPPPPVADNNDMVFMDHSPDFCRRGQYSYGTGGRICNKSSNCDSICCGRGYNIRNNIKITACNCRFNWCCDVICSKCTEREEVYSCKS